VLLFTLSFRFEFFEFLLTDLWLGLLRMFLSEGRLDMRLSIGVWPLLRFYDRESFLTLLLLYELFLKKLPELSETNPAAPKGLVEDLKEELSPYAFMILLL
jgi:membrane-bound metal-dependent hydrolase YbcI (DUF457 family)